MKIAVCGLWHLGTVTATCLAAAGHEVVGYDSLDIALERINGMLPVIDEPGLGTLLVRCLHEKKLSFIGGDPRLALDGAELVWITWDVLAGDVAAVLGKIEKLFPWFPPGCTVLISSQLPVGSTAKIEAEFVKKTGRDDVGFAYSPENLRHGKAIECFTKPEMVVVGCSNRAIVRKVYDALFPVIYERSAPIGTTSIPVKQFLTMSVASAELSKHAINAFLAMQIALTNELAEIAEKVGADPKDVERALRTEPRIGPNAYVRAGEAFIDTGDRATLARDLKYLWM
jgi:UDPglucose 6-dehydrogenase